MPYATLLVADTGAIRRITLNRPDKLNALNRETLGELHRAFDDAATDDAVRVVVLTGAGPKAFVAGADIAEMNGLSVVEAREFSLHGQRLMSRIERLGKPVLAMVNGFALGGGLELAMACHLRIAADTAKVGQPEVNLGLVPGFGGSQRLARLAGRGQPIDAARAAQLGVLTRVVPADQLEAETMKLAEQLARAAPLALRGILDSILVGGDCALEAGLDYETQQFAVAFSTEDMKEGTGAFLARRPPQFSGR
jgi:enoyl-CoA hydratase